ncbi:hypothetical protein KEH51_27745 [[Brevibacterium] frigoritolerans]|uniref:Uncharacterized protein n=1 Tax=Peribacillus frigoritolerans TaxID=450367 RepID=A0A941J6L7_9BACI|nr:hypothetical protein [Peribacillus frigoritolerans]
MEYLKEYGYTLFSSNFHGANWGSPKALDLSLNLYILFMKKEIVNQRVHILAEGTGALLALKLMNELGNKIRSVVLIDPVFSLKAQLEKEKENKFFYKSGCPRLLLHMSLSLRNVSSISWTLKIQ